MLIVVNVGHMATEILPFIIDSLMEIGAENVQACSTLTKKSRPGFILFIDAEKELIEPISEFLMRELGVIGLKALKLDQHVKFDYEIRSVEILSADSPTVAVRVKCIRDRKGEIASIHAEYEEIKNALYVLRRKGRRISLRILKEIVETVALTQEPVNYRDVEVRSGGQPITQPKQCRTMLKPS